MILVTGGAGYIGSAVCKALHEHGYEHVVLDNLSKGYRDFVRWGKLVVGDISDEKILSKIFSKYDIKAVMHFAGFIEVEESVREPEKYYENNFCKTLRLLNAMVKHGVKYFIFSSSAAVYGIPKIIPIPEEHETKPINPYGESKLFVEKALKSFEKAHRLRYISLRYFNATGAWGEVGELHKPETHLIPLVLQAALGLRENVKIYGTDYNTKDGTCIRDFIHVVDLAEAHILALEYLLQKDKSEIFNLGSERGYSVRQVIETVRNITKNDINVVEAERREGDPPILIASNEKAKRLLGWRPKFGLEEAIESAWKWYARRRDCSDGG